MSVWWVLFLMCENKEMIKQKVFLTIPEQTVILLQMKNKSCNFKSPGFDPRSLHRLKYWEYFFSSYRKRTMYSAFVVLLLVDSTTTKIKCLTWCMEKTCIVLCVETVRFFGFVSIASRHFSRHKLRLRPEIRYWQCL